MFNNTSRLGYDKDTYSQDDILNNDMANYMTYNPFSKKSVDDIEIYPHIHTNKSTFNVSPLGSNINESSMLTKGTLTNQNDKLTLFERPYKTVPYLGNGNVDTYKENKIRLGDIFKEKKSDVKLNEKCYNNIEKYPMQKKVKKKCKINDNEWIRGNIDSRIMYKTN